MITAKNEIEKYYQDPSLNQSRLKTLLKSMEMFKYSNASSEMYYEEKESFVIGSAVDCKLTGSQEDYEEQYYISSDEDKPSATIMSILNMVHDGCTPSCVTLDNLQDRIILAVNKHDYYPKWPDETRVAKILAHSAYFEDLRKSAGKQVLSQEQSSLVDSIVKSLKDSTVTGPYLKETDTMKTVFQKPLYFIYKGVKCKALPDLIVYHTDRMGKILAVQLVDLKTMYGYVKDFPMSFRKYRYDIQAAWYTKALSASLEKLGLLPDTQILPFMFMVQSTTNIGDPIMFEVSEEALSIGEFGRKELRANGVLVKPKVVGFEELVQDYLYYERQGWQRDRLLDVNKGVLKLGWEGIETERR